MNTGNEQREALRHEAYGWLVRLTSGTATVADAAAFKLWRGQTPAHAEAFAEADALWERLGPASREANSVNSATIAGLPVGRRPLMGRRAVLVGAIAASAAGVLIVRPPLELWPSWSEFAADYRTGTGERKQISVAGGVLDLNTRTSLAVRSIEGRGAVELIAGELAITTGPSQFELIAAAGRMAATTARFNVRLDDRKACVTCLEGEVELEHQARHVKVRQGQQVLYGDRELSEAATVDPATVTAWHRGMLVFHSEPLGRVIEEVNRYRPGKVMLVNGQLRDRRIEASFRLDRVDDVITLVHEAYGARVTRLPGGIVLLS